MQEISVVPLPAFEDNYIWTLTSKSRAVVVDPGDAAPVLQMLDAHQLSLEAILITHWHPDHTGGIAELTQRFANVAVFGPAAEEQKIPGLTRKLGEDERIDVLGLSWRTIAVPGHTLGHIAYYSPGRLLCGDTLFSAGCGRLYEGTAAQMHASLSKLAALPADTQVYCTHEYTLSNLKFAQAVEPNNGAVSQHIEQVRARLEKREASLPSTVGVELQVNPFLRTAVPAVADAARKWSGEALEDEVAVFATLRKWKDEFK